MYARQLAAETTSDHVRNCENQLVAGRKTANIKVN
jgi:hypothetical protein